METKFEKLQGKVLVKIEVDTTDNFIIFTTDNYERYKLWHHQDCCEQVFIEDICGDMDDLIGLPILLAEEVTNRNNAPKTHVGYDYTESDDEVVEVDEPDESFTWTFYKLSTIKGDVTIRWYGTSNGYYSERVDFAKECKKCKQFDPYTSVNEETGVCWDCENS